MIRLLVFTLLLSGAARADFYQPDSVPSSIRPAGFAVGRAAALQIPASDNEMGCSATVISNSGHVLTALHCVPQCVRSNGNGSVSNFSYQSPDFDALKKGQDRCSISFAQEGQSLGSMKAVVVAAGAGFVESINVPRLIKELADPSKLQSFLTAIRAGIGVAGDFAILQVPELASRPCARASQQAPQLSQVIWDIAYPKQSYRDHGLGTRGEVAVFSRGIVTYSALQPTVFAASTADQAYNLMINRDGQFVSTVDSNEGASGAALFDDQGEVVGVLNAAGLTEAQMTSSYKEIQGHDKNGNLVNLSTNGSRKASRIDFIRNYTSQVFGSQVSAAAFSCQ